MKTNLCEIQAAGGKAMFTTRHTAQTVKLFKYFVNHDQQATSAGRTLMA